MQCHLIVDEASSACLHTSARLHSTWLHCLCHADSRAPQQQPETCA